MNVLVLGGGLAGLSAAAKLADKGHRITLLEASPKLGGRTYSFYDRETGTFIDNGQHIMMGCYDKTLQFVKMIGAEDKLEIQDNLDVVLLKRGGEKFELQTKSSLHPFNLMKGLMDYKAISINDRLKVIDFFLDLAFVKPDDLLDLTVEKWLMEKGQSYEAIKSLWEILAIGTLNSSTKTAAASSFCTVLKAMFLRDNFSSKIILPKSGLSQLFCEPAEKYLNEHGASVQTSERVVELNSSNGRITEVITNRSSYTNFDCIVSALPLYALTKISKDIPDFLSKLNLKYSPIINTHVWLKNNIMDERFTGLIGSDFHWIFNNGTHLTVTTSAAEELVNLTDRELEEKLFDELQSYLPVFSPNLVVICKTIREKKATFIPSTDTEKKRMIIGHSHANIRLAGDWINTGLPATIEGAVSSGFKAAESI